MSFVIFQMVVWVFSFCIGLFGQWSATVSRWLGIFIVRFCFPTLIFHGFLVLANPLQLAVVAFVISALMAFMGKVSNNDYPIGIRSCAYSYFSIGIFGIPAAQAIYGDDALPILSALYLGNSIFGTLVGGYLLRKDSGLPGSLYGFFRSPVFVAVVLGFTLHALGQEATGFFQTYLNRFFEVVQLITPVLGMILMGLYFKASSYSEVNWEKVVFFLGIRFVIAVMLITAIGVLCFYLGIISLSVLRVLLLLPLFPIASNVLPLVYTFSNHSLVERNALNALFLGSMVLSLVFTVLVGGFLSLVG